MKYTIDGNIDFFAELYKSFETKHDNIETDEGKCLITHEPLIDKYVKMECGHTFNYIPLFTDLLNHKYLYNLSEYSESKLSPNEIRCPYCRKKQTTLLPYYEELGFEKIKGINQPAYANCLNKCFYKTQNKFFNENMIESFLNEKEKDCFCMPTHVIDNKLYCYKHHFKIMKNKIKEAIQKKKEEDKQKMIAKKQSVLEQKLKLKEQKQKMKEEKLKLKEEKLKMKNKMSFTNINTEVIIPEPKTCICILKRGERKGLCCGKKIYNEQLCKRHCALMKIKINKNENNE